MKLDKETMKKIMFLITFTCIVFAGIMNLDKTLHSMNWVWGMFFPFILGGAIAFAINVPMKAIEERLLKKVSLTTKKGKSFKRVVSLLLTLLFMILVIVIVVFVVFPKLSDTIAVLIVDIEASIPKVTLFFENLFKDNPQIMEWLNSFEIDYKSIVTEVTNFLKNGAGDWISTSINFATSVVSALMNFMIAFIFAIYILFQKEKLKRQINLLLKAILPIKAVNYITHVSVIAYSTFSNFVTGQCLEATILGAMFVVSMTILNLPFALLVGVLIAFTALIPIFGAFIGCMIGAFIILIESSTSALIFVILFLVLQQVEGNLIYPNVVGSKVGLPSIWVMVAVTVGASLMGIVGMLVFIPICSILYALLREWTYSRLEKKNMLEGS